MKHVEHSVPQAYPVTARQNLYVQNSFPATGIGISSKTKHMDFFPHFRPLHPTRVTNFRDIIWFYSVAPFQSWTRSKTNCLTLLIPKKSGFWLRKA
jgi:hypothetical protein